MSHDLEPPFVRVTDVAKVFGGIPNMAAAIAACPKDFRQGGMTGYRLLANDLFAHLAGWRSMTDAQLSELKEATDMERYTEEKWNYIQSWLTSHSPSHHDKEAVVAWCLSLVMKAPPPYTVR